MANPTFVAEVESAWNSSTTPKTSPTITGVAGDRIAVIGITADTTVTLSTPTNSGTAQTWTLEESVGPTDFGRVYIWSCTLSVTQNFTVSVARGGATFNWGFSVHQYRDSDGFGVSTSGTGTGGPSLVTSSLSADSAVVVGSVDWNAVDGATRTWRSVDGSAITESTYYRDSTNYGLYVGRAFSGAAGTETVGLSAPTGQKYAIAYLEVLGTSGGATNYNGTSALAATDTITATGQVGKATGASVSATASLTAAGTMASSTGASLAATSTITASGAVGTSSGAAIAATAAITAAGSVVSGSSGSAALAATGTITAAGAVAASTGASQAATATISAAGQVGTSKGSSLAETATITASGAVGKVTGASLAATAAITASGTVISGLSRAASLTSTATITAAGRVDTTSSAGLSATASIAASGVVSAHDTGTAALQAVATITATGTVTTAAGRLYHFNPPTMERRFSENPAMFLWVRVPYQVGLTVVKTTGGQYRQEELHNTNATDIDVVYLGGHVYLVDSDEAASLTASGYGSFLTEVP